MSWPLALLGAAALFIGAVAVMSRSDVDRDPQYRLTPLEYAASAVIWGFVFVVAIVAFAAFALLSAVARLALEAWQMVRECWDELMREAK